MKCNEVHSHSRLPIAYTWIWRSQLTSLTHTNTNTHSHLTVRHSATFIHARRAAAFSISGSFVRVVTFSMVRVCLFYHFERTFYSHCRHSVGVIFNQLVFCPKYFRYVLSAILHDDDLEQCQFNIILIRSIPAKILNDLDRTNVDMMGHLNFEHFIFSMKINR